MQLHVREFFKLKEGAHPCYEACRSLGLAGALRQDSEETSTQMSKLSLGTRLRITALRFFVGCFAVFMACGYLVVVFYYDVHPDLWGKPAWFRVLRTVSAALPYSILTFLIASDMVRSLSRKLLCFTLAAGCLLLVGLGAALNLLSVFIAIAVVYVVHFVAAFVSVRFCGGHAQGRSRVGLLCEW